MTTTVTLIADKDIGSVLGAVTETSADEALKVEQIVAESGFLLRDALTGAALEVPRSELTTAAATGLAAVREPRSYVVKDGVATSVGSAMTVSTVILKPAQIEIKFGSDPGQSNVKVIVCKRGTSAVEIFRVTKATPVATTPPATPFMIAVGASLQANAFYDTLVLVEGYRASFTENLQV